MFHIFKVEQERRAFGGSEFIELQYCMLKAGTSEHRIVAVHSVCNWKSDSLYVHADDIDEFLQNYNEVFIDGLYNNMQHGKIDPYGINYYSMLQTVAINKRLESLKPCDYQALSEWLNKKTGYNGIYILGI